MNYVEGGEEGDGEEEGALTNQHECVTFAWNVGLVSLNVFFLFSWLLLKPEQQYLVTTRFKKELC